MRFLLFLSICFSVFGCASTQKSFEFSSRFTNPLASFPFNALKTVDSLGREVTFYLSNSEAKTLPLILFIQGSGCVSHFKRNPDGSISGGYQNLLLETAKGKAHVMVVEKPGVNFLDFNSTPGTAENCSMTFREQHTLENWTIALNAALNEALKQPQINPNKIVVIGHSEGAIAAASLAAVNPQITDAAILSGSGVSQLFDFIVNKNTDEVASVYTEFEKINADPTNATTLVWGHPYKRWASFLSASTVEFLKKSSAQIFVVHGTADRAVPIQSSDALAVELKRVKRPFTELRIKDADHSLNLPTDIKPAGMKRVFEQTLEWAHL